MTGEYTGAFIIAAVASLLSLIGTIYLMRLRESKAKTVEYSAVLAQER